MSVFKPELQPIENLKFELKELIKEIRSLKVKLKLNKRRPNETLGYIQSRLKMKQQNYRLKHIVYCELKGISRNKIEYHTKQKCFCIENNIERIKEHYYCPKRYTISDICVNLL